NPERVRPLSGALCESPKMMRPRQTCDRPRHGLPSKMVLQARLTGDALYICRYGTMVKPGKPSAHRTPFLIAVRSAAEIIGASYLRNATLNRSSRSQLTLVIRSHLAHTGRSSGSLG